MDAVEDVSVNPGGDGYAFRFALPEDGLALSSVSVANGIPKISFFASPKVPTITEEDFAVVFKVVSDGKRPEFYFYTYPPRHPFHSEQYNGYHPKWLRGTSIGNLLFQADWKMKCLHVGARTDESMSKFYSWKASSNLQGLATWPDFPKDAKPIGHSVIMSCESVEVQKDENSLEFVGDPVIKITDQTNSLYTKYISEIFPNIAYHDEPLFLKMRELSKLILACEFLKEKGVKISENWVSEYTSKPKISRNPLQHSRAQEYKCVAQPSKKPPYEMIPKPTVVQCPSDDVTVQTWEAEQYRCLTKCGIKYCYGYCNDGALMLFDEDGQPLRQEKFVRYVAERTVTMGDKKISESKMMHNIPPSILFSIKPPLTASEFDETCLNFTTNVVTPLGPATLHAETDEIPTVNGTRLEIKTTLQLLPPLAPVTETIIIKSSMTNYDMLYGNYAPPTQPLGISKDGELVIPDVETWSELHSESVPWPQCFQVPYTGVGEPSPSGGVSTRNMEVRTSSERRQTDSGEIRSRWDGQFRQNGNRLDVQAMHGVPTGKITLLNKLSQEFSAVATCFKNQWDQRKGICPAVRYVFSITNQFLKSKWEAYKARLPFIHQSVERHYHGTSLTCDLPATKTLCQYPSCGICGISSCGLNPKCIGQNISFQRFGAGYYLAPHSSKCNDYAESRNGFRALLSCDVLPGHKYQLTKTDQTLQGPPPGFNSVFGNVGGDLNYPEIVLYDPDSVLARYIIVY